MSIRRTIPEGGYFPGRWWKPSHDEWQMDGSVRVVCYPVPLNLIVRLARVVYFSLDWKWIPRWRAAGFICRRCRSLDRW